MTIATNLVPNKNSISFSLWEHHRGVMGRTKTEVKVSPLSSFPSLMALPLIAKTIAQWAVGHLKIDADCCHSIYTDSTLY